MPTFEIPYRSIGGVYGFSHWIAGDAIEWMKMRIWASSGWPVVCFYLRSPSWSNTVDPGSGRGLRLGRSEEWHDVGLTV